MTITFDNDAFLENLLEWKDNLILFKPIKGVSTFFTSQYIRLLYPALLNYKNGIMITYMDMLPMNKTYFTDNIKPFSNDKFIYLRDCLLSNNQIAMRYNVATNTTWSDIFNIKSLEDITNRLIESSKNSGWSTDQRHLYKYVMDWNKKTNNFISLRDTDTKFKRLCRSIQDPSNINFNHIKNQKFDDYHCFRPYKDYKEINDLIYEAL